MPLAALDGWFALLVALPLTEDVTVFSQDGILYLFGAAIALVLLGALGIGCCRLIRLIRSRADGGKAGAPLTPAALGILLLSTIALANLLMLSLLNTRYGNATYEDRYLILMYCASMLIFVALLSQSGLPLPAGAHRGCRRSLYRHPYPNGADGCDQQHGRFAAFSGCVHLHGHRRVQPDDAQHALLRSFPCV